MGANCSQSFKRAMVKHKVGLLTSKRIMRGRVSVSKTFFSTSFLQDEGTQTRKQDESVKKRQVSESTIEKSDGLPPISPKSAS